MHSNSCENLVYQTQAPKSRSGKSGKSGKSGQPGKSTAHKKGARMGKNTRVNWGRFKWTKGRAYVFNCTGPGDLTCVASWREAVVEHGGQVRPVESM